MLPGTTGMCELGFRVTRFLLWMEQRKERFEIPLQEMNDAVDDSDDEVDYTKMDLGNKKVISFHYFGDVTHV